MAKSIIEIRVEIVPDPDPDLSWLTGYANISEDQSPEAIAEQVEANDQRVATYGDEWYMVGVRAVAEVEVNGVRETITSAGVWGVESDSSTAHFEEVQVPELAALNGMLAELGFDHTEIFCANPAGITTPRD